MSLITTTQAAGTDDYDLLVTIRARHTCPLVLELCNRFEDETAEALVAMDELKLEIVDLNTTIARLKDDIDVLEQERDYPLMKEDY
jgi:hypothetical protein